ncbi:DEAD/DEAH box helicase [Alteromonas sp. ASW11-36]|uniref:DEAD/DEAH box helicase n=1 Tax=Alteromonas arenosi TaxID=3055817 RepID=A0ABT7T0G1_9ALTE|nr:DEAD/DEAH box helicase [Alteromonas sp. ASW11-36]MDM7861922.1 DEAD/DEAH box helicase [Alteromonas sp. ASW11-36]
MKGFFSTLKRQANSRAKEATLSVLGINKPGLRNHLSAKMEGDEAFVHGPVFEQMFAWERDLSSSMEELSDQGLLSKAVIDALDAKNNDRYRFNREWYPFKHQHKAWKDLLAPKAQSRIITSGTGSGKTECFMIPVLEDLYRESIEAKAQLSGVRALFLYPLNALINSQRERLNAWTKHFDGDIRFCLFNGKTPEYLESKERQRQKANPQEVMSREGLREDPAQILVTNGTMLEYMLIRQADAPIIEQSKGKLRWIVLDEAHTYVGSQAAELALQLRRVMQAFEVKPENIRFVATSATIAGEEAENSLKRYLANLANISEDQVDVIGGRRRVPQLTPAASESLTLNEIEAIEPEGETPDSKKEKREPAVSQKRFNALVNNTIAMSLRALLTKQNSPPKTIEELKRGLSEFNLTENEIYRWLDVCTNTRPSYNGQDEAFLKLRAHYFQRTLDGIWACIDKQCSHKANTPLDEQWPFGTVYSTHRVNCECGAPVLELAFCDECNEPHLLGAYDTNSMLQQWVNRQEDEFSLTEGERELDPDDAIDESGSDNDNTTRTSQPVVFSNNVSEAHNYHPTSFDKTGKMAFGDGDINLAANEEQLQECADCGHTGRGQNGRAFRRCLLGAPFYATNAVPTVLEYCPDFERDEKEKNKEGPNSLPGRGRRLITFTDSRQGTAKISVSMQQEAERSHFRGVLVRELRKSLESKMDLAPELLEKVKAYQSMPLEKMKELLPVIAQVNTGDAEALKTYISALEGGSQSKVQPKPMQWLELTGIVKSDNDIAHSMTIENRYLDPEVFERSDATKLSEMLLTREIARRPKFRNNIETQGLIKLVYPGIEAIDKTPEFWAEHKLSLRDWKDYLKVCMDFFVRENTYVAVNDEWSRWIGMHFYPKFLIDPDSKDEDENRIKKWPLVKTGNKRQQRIITLLAKAAGFEKLEAREESILNTWLKAAWKALVDTRTLSEVSNKQFQLRLNTVQFSLMSEAFICPITNKLLDTTFKGVTPYIPWNKDAKDYVCEKVTLPSIWEFNTGTNVSTFIDEVREKVANDDRVAVLREQNLWTDINDRAVEGGFYYTNAEHSAQQSSENLERYEEEFKEGRKNVLNCSTTMEMGVDIGGISAVVMNNVPPHPANYLQRAGRAGRSSEARAIGYTICKNNPHDQFVFNQPKWPFITEIPAPTVTFSSSKLVQRHVNAFLLGKFLREKIGLTQKERLFLSLEWFYLKQDAQQAIYERFIDWLSANSANMKHELDVLVRGTSLSSCSQIKLCDEAKQKVVTLAERWRSEYQYIQDELNATDSEFYKHKLEKDLRCLSREYLLRDLATRGFLPGYGFPTDVVNLSVYSLTDFLREKENERKKDINESRDDNVSLSRGMPSRNLAVAIREFAPGTELVLDGRVHRSAGITLNWQNVHVEGAKDAQKFDIAWKCDSCGQTGYETELNKQSGLVCTNPKCGKAIKVKHQRNVIEPTGFVVDFYHPPSNNIAHTQFVPVEKPWVMGKSEHIPLPNPEVGHMVADSEGHVFHHCSGVNGTGYGICLGCGRAESMTLSEELPLSLSYDKPHRPPMPNRFQRNADDKPECDASGKILEGIHLGYNTTTDVFELLLRNPESKACLHDKTTATTIAVALRKALVDQLGISVSEVGYSTRPALVDGGAHAEVVQLFDIVSGGAGFATSAKHVIKSLLESMFEVLSCNDDCEKYCHSCLLENDSRHDIDRLDRKQALTWLQENIQNHLSLPSQVNELLGRNCSVSYVASTLQEKLSEVARSKPDTLRFVFSGQVSDWDTATGPFKARFHSLLSDEINVQVIVPNKELGKEVTRFLSELSRIGVEIITADVEHNVVFQVTKDSHCLTIANIDERATLPGEHWLVSEQISVESDCYPRIEGQKVELEPPQKIGAQEIPALKELNGSLVGLGNRLIHFWSEKESRLKDELSSTPLEKVVYTDRYLQSPSSLLMLSELLSTLAKDQKLSIEVNTCFDVNDRAREGFAIHHDWVYEDDYETIFTGWLSHACSQDVQVNMAEKAEIPHRRTLVLYFQNGKVITIVLDQGLGYWKLYLDRGLHNFDFRRSVNEQVTRLGEAYGRAKVYNSADWQTWFTINVATDNT